MEPLTSPNGTLPTTDCVFLVHGLWMSGFVCWYWQRVLQRSGLATELYSYPSVRNTLDQNADRLWASVQKTLAKRQEAGQAVRVHFVGHSLGGIVILHMLRRYGAQLPELGRVVLCGSPVNGSYCARNGANWPVFGRALGHSILAWHGIAADELPAGLELATIAGTRPIGLGRIVPGLPSPSDGTVSLKETELDWAADRLIVHLNHSELLIAPYVAKQIGQFLKKGHFQHHV